MNRELRRKCNDLSKHLSETYDYHSLTSDNTYCLMIMIHDGIDFLLTGDEVKENQQYITKMFMMYHRGLHPADIRNYNQNYEY